MKKMNPILVNQDITLKLITEKDLPMYYTKAFENFDPVIEYLTGTTQTFTKQQIIDHVQRIVNDETRYDFLIQSTTEEFLGEVVLNEIDWHTRIAGFRITLFSHENCNTGIGTKVIPMLLQFAFETLHLHRIELEVFDFNERAKHVYEKCGFQIEGKKRDALYIKDSYHDVYIMGILEADYIALQNV